MTVHSSRISRHMCDFAFLPLMSVLEPAIGLQTKRRKEFVDTAGKKKKKCPTKSNTHFPYSSRENLGDGDRDCSNCSENGFKDCDFE